MTHTHTHGFHDDITPTHPLTRLGSLLLLSLLQFDAKEVFLLGLVFYSLFDG